MAAVVVRADAAGAVAVEAGDRIDGAGDEGLAEDVKVGGHGGRINTNVVTKDTNLLLGVRCCRGLWSVNALR